MALDFFCEGIPVAQGSKRHVGGGRLIESNDKTLRPWRATLAAAAFEHGRGHHFFDAVKVELSFSFPRPAAHYGTGRNAGKLKQSAPVFKKSAPDVDKLARAVLDSLVAAGVLRNDAQVASLTAVKVYDRPSGVRVNVSRA